MMKYEGPVIVAPKVEAQDDEPKTDTPPEQERAKVERAEVLELARKFADSDPAVVVATLLMQQRRFEVELMKRVKDLADSEGKSDKSGYRRNRIGFEAKLARGRRSRKS